MVYNSLQPIFAPVNRNYGLDQLYPVFAAVGQARQFSPALLQFKSLLFEPNRRQGRCSQTFFRWPNIETANGAPNFNEVVFGFCES